MRAPLSLSQPSTAREGTERGLYGSLATAAPMASPHHPNGHDRLLFVLGVVLIFTAAIAGIEGQTRLGIVLALAAILSLALATPSRRL